MTYPTPDFLDGVLLADPIIADASECSCSLPHYYLWFVNCIDGRPMVEDDPYYEVLNMN